MADTSPRDRKFETLFDGDEIDGTRYELGDTVTGLDAATAAYLVRNGRIAELDDGDSITADDDDGDDEFATSAATDFAEGRIPDDLVNADSTSDDKLISRKELDRIAKDGSVETSSSMDKADVARAIMASRARASA